MSVATIIAPEIRLAQVAGNSTRIAGVASRVEGFLGRDAVVKVNNSKKFVALSKDGLRRFRIDNLGHGDRPHAHLEVFNGKSFVDVGTHRIYFR